MPPQNLPIPVGFTLSVLPQSCTLASSVHPTMPPRSFLPLTLPVLTQRCTFVYFAFPAMPPDFPRAAHGAAAVGTAGNGAPYDKTAHGANIIVTVKGRTLHGNVLYGSVVCIADQTDIIYTCVRVGQPGDGFAVAVKYAFEPVGFCANGRPLRVFIYGDVVHQPGVDRSFAAVYGLGKPSAGPFHW